MQIQSNSSLPISTYQPAVKDPVSLPPAANLGPIDSASISNNRAEGGASSQLLNGFAGNFGAPIPPPSNNTPNGNSYGGGVSPVITGPAPKPGDPIPPLGLPTGPARRLVQGPARPSFKLPGSAEPPIVDPGHGRPPAKINIPGFDKEPIVDPGHGRPPAKIGIPGFDKPPIVYPGNVG